MNNVPMLLWNHRWEYDKNPEDFFEALFILQNEGFNFEVAILGEKFKKYPIVFDAAKEKLGSKIVHFGFVSDKNEYISWLKKADIIPVTSNQDFFGESLVQAMCHNCYPLVPNRLVFPEHFPDEVKSNFIYNSNEELLLKLKELIVNIDKVRNTKVRHFVEKYSWKNMINIYDNEFEKLVK